MTLRTLARVAHEDPHNRTVIANTHPPGWTNPEPRGRYNMVVLGGGTAGLVSAAGAAILGAKVALVERHLMGGDCLNTGCVPSKGLIRAARAAAMLHHAGEFGIHTGAGTVDFERVMERVRRVRAEISYHDSIERFQRLGVEIFLGHARFGGPDWVEVDGQRLRFKKAVIATGARPMALPIDGLEAAGYLTNETAFDLTELPRSLLVVGGGPIGAELAQALARLGSQVTLAEMMPRFLPNEDPDAAALLAGALERDGVVLRLSTTLGHVEGAADGKRCKLTHEGVEETLTVDEILIGVGRRPNVEDLGLERVGVEYDVRRGVHVNDRLQTSNRRIYAAGDVTLKHKFTHTADAAARIVLQNALFFGRKKLSSLTVPWCTYTSPEVAHVGLCERDAQERGVPLETIRVAMGDVDRAIIDGNDEGFVKVHLKKGTDRILGATIVGAHAGELISELSLAMVHGVGLGGISKVIHPYPTQAEAIRRAADEYNRRRLTPRRKKLLTRWFAMRR